MSSTVDTNEYNNHKHVPTVRVVSSPLAIGQIFSGTGVLVTYYEDDIPLSFQKGGGVAGRLIELVLFSKLENLVFIGNIL
jgi:hypothetical protein